jgi:DNA-binding IclR family transcriptional regulator
LARMNVDERWSSIEQAARGGDTPLVQGFMRGFAVLRAFRADEDYLSNSEIALRANIPRSTVSRLTQTLAALGFLTYAPGLGRYSLGAGLATLCHALLSGMPCRVAALPHLRQLAETTKLPISLGMRDQLDMVYIETARHAGAKPHRFDLGTRMPIDVTSMGRAYLYGLPENERKTLLDAIRKECGEARWRKIRQGLKHAFQMLDKKGFCASFGDWRPDVQGVAVPIVTPSGAVVAMNCGGPPTDVSPERLEHEIGPMLAAAAARIVAEANKAEQSGLRTVSI